MGAATSIAAFVGWAARGPTQYAGPVQSWADFERIYGGFDARSPHLGHAVNHFFSNGGQQAYIVRVVYSGPPTASLTPAGSASLKLGGLTFTAGAADPDGAVDRAANPGVWAQDYGIAIQNLDTSAGRFRVHVVYAPPGAPSEVVVESFENLSIAAPDPQGRFIADAINKQSSFVTVAVDKDTKTPPGDTGLPSPKLKGKATDDGTVLLPSASAAAGGEFEIAVAASTAILDQIDLFNLLCVPGEIEAATIGALEKYCEGRRAFLIADSDPSVTDVSKISGPPTTGANGAIYFPWVIAPDPANENQPRSFPPSGFVAGVYAQTDETRGVWKPPAGTGAILRGASGVSVPLTDGETGILGAKAINTIRSFPSQPILVWGARTTQGSDALASEWKYIPVRRTALFIEESLYRGLKWVVFEPNGEPLWSQIRLNVGAFMQTLFQQGAFQGQTASQAYAVKCDNETTTQTDIDQGVVNIVVGFAPLKPGEFVLIRVQEKAGKP